MQYQLFDTVLAALYLKGAPRLTKHEPKNWPLIQNLLPHRLNNLNQIIHILENNGYSFEADTLKSKQLIDWVQKKLNESRILTLSHQDYPEKWKKYSADLAPPALWKMGEIPTKKFISIVGSRQPNQTNIKKTSEFAKMTTILGYSLCSGGAIGVDSIASKSVDSGEILEILPYGLNQIKRQLSTNILTAVEPNGTFTTPNAMERNSLIYAIADLTIVVQPRYMKGGSWHGAVTALKKNLTRVAVVGNPQSKAIKSLINKGAHYAPSPESIEKLLQTKLDLFD